MRDRMDTRPRWVHYIDFYGRSSVAGICEMAQMTVGGEIMPIRAVVGLVDLPIGLMAYELRDVPHATDHRFGSWHDLWECQGGER